MKANQLSRTNVRSLRARSLGGDADAARRLLAHSVASGHDRLGLRRYFIARLLNAERLDEFRPFCAGVAASMEEAQLRAIVSDLARIYRSDADVAALLHELLAGPASARSCRRAFGGVAPAFASPPLFEGRRSAVLGRAALGSGAVIGAGAVIRADGNFVTVGDDFVLAPQATVHIAHEVHPTVIGHRVAAGRNAIIHACTVGDRCVIGDDAIVLDGSVIEDDVLLDPGAVVFPRSRLEAGYVYSGSPARMVRRAEPGEIEAAHAAIRDATMREEGEGAGSAPDTAGAAGGRFVASTAMLEGDVALAAGASVFFGCVMAAGPGRIAIGRDTNVQDNSVVRGDTLIGEETTIGHNVAIDSAVIGARSLIGMGARLAPGTRVEDDVLLAAGSSTTPGQTLEGGWLWGGRPAVRMKPMDEARRAMMRDTIRQYCEYADNFQQAMA